jgi:hypothetical protein
VTKTLKIAAVFLADRVGAQDAEDFAARLPSNHEWRQIIEEWLEGDASYLIAVDLTDRVLVGTPDRLADLRTMIGVARNEDPGTLFHLKFVCSHETGAALIDIPGVIAVDWQTPPIRH